MEERFGRNVSRDHFIGETAERNNRKGTMREKRLVRIIWGGEVESCVVEKVGKRSWEDRVERKGC